MKRTNLHFNSKEIEVIICDLCESNNENDGFSMSCKEIEYLLSRKLFHELTYKMLMIIRDYFNDEDNAIYKNIVKKVDTFLKC